MIFYCTNCWSMVLESAKMCPFAASCQYEYTPDETRAPKEMGRVMGNYLKY